MATIDARIQNLRTTTFGGRRFTRRQLAQVQDLVGTFPDLSRKELAQTLCEQLRWHTPAGGNRVQAALQLLEDLEECGILSLPPQRRLDVRCPRKPIPPTPRSDPRPLIETNLATLTPLRLQRVEEAADVALFREYIDRYHYLGYRQPMGPYLGYLVLDRHERPLVCQLFSPASRTLACRDAWVGWSKDEYKRHLHLVVGQTRFLVLPWVRVDHLASHALALAMRRLPQDWQLVYGCQPVLIETFVDPNRFRGTCYRAANWQHIGQTEGRGKRSIKDVFIYPLSRHCREILRTGPPKRRPRPRPASQRAAVCVDPDPTFVRLWQDREMLAALTAVAASHDELWQARRGVLDTRLVMLFLYCLVFSQGQSYSTALAALWANCRALDVPLSQPAPVSEAAMTRARQKIDPLVFRQFHAEILRRADQSGQLWLGHRMFAVNSSSVILPGPLTEAGYRLPFPEARYPQGLFSSLYRLPSGLPVDLDLHADSNESTAALRYPKTLRPDDLVLYGHGCYSFELLCVHRHRRQHAVFRLAREIGPAVDDFVDSDRPDDLIEVLPGAVAPDALSAKYPDATWRPVPLRLVKYRHAGTIQVLGTTLLDRQRYRTVDLAALYHAPWGLERLQGLNRQFLQIEQFHSRSESLVRQELWARCNLEAMKRALRAGEEAPRQPTQTGVRTAAAVTPLRVQREVLQTLP